MTTRTRILLIPTVLLLIASSAIAGAAQPATPGADDAIRDHREWVESLFAGEAANLTEAEVEQRFDTSFLELVPAGEFIASIQPLAEQLGPLEQIDDQSREPGEFIGVFEAESGDRVMIAFAVDPDTGLMTGFFITPADASAPTGTPVATPAASPEASPVAAGPVVDDPAAQMALYDELVAEIRAVSEPAIDAVLAGDDESLGEYLAPEIASALEGTSIAAVIDSYTSSQIQAVFAEAGVVFFGQWSDTTIDGWLVQGGTPTPFTLEAEEAQNGDLPTGRFTGGTQQGQLEFSLEFTTDADGNLAASLDIPAQGITSTPLSDVQYLPERPIEEMVDESVLPHSGTSNMHRADFAWGDHLLRITVSIDVETQQVVTLQVLPAVPTPPASPDAPEAQATYQLPFEGTWWVFWGGETEFRNYHAATPSQRHAYDVAIWKDGATFQGDGTSNEDYWAWGQPVYAPAGGTVVSVANDLPDIEPNLPPGQRDASQTPAGNHVVIETAESEYLFVAHLQQGSVQVEAGDEITAGEQIGLTGNSGNTSEPHIHIHVQDSPEILDYQANGIPLAFESAVVDGEPKENSVPQQGSFVAPE